MKEKKKLVARCGGTCLLFLNDLLLMFLNVCFHVCVCIRMLDPLELNELQTGVSCQMRARN